MKLSERRVNGVTIIEVSGDLLVPSDNPRALREKVTKLLERGERRIIVNVAKLRYMDSSFVGEIVASYKAAASNGGALKLAHVGPHLSNVLRTTSLDTILKSYATETDAIESFGDAV